MNITSLDTHNLAYLAGVVDADGSLGFYKGSSPKHGWTQYFLALTIAQVEPQAADLAASMFGGYRATRPPRPDSRGISAKSALQIWRLGGQPAADAVAALRPYLRIKKAQADYAARIMNVIGDGRSWKESRDRRRRLGEGFVLGMKGVRRERAALNPLSYPAFVPREEPLKLCVISECSDPPIARGWCGAHYATWRRNGNPTALRPRGRRPQRKEVASNAR